jgi:hypothetical protein
VRDPGVKSVTVGNIKDESLRRGKEKLIKDRYLDKIEGHILLQK